MREPTVASYTVEASMPGIAHAGGVVVVDPNERSILVTRRVAWSKYPELMIRSAYRDLCERHADYRTADKTAVDQQHRDPGERAVDTTKEG